MKRLLLLLAVVTLMSLVYNITLVYETFQDEVTGDNDNEMVTVSTRREGGSSMDGNQKICFTPRNNRLPIYTAIRDLRDDISSIKLEMDTQADKISILSEGSDSAQAGLDNADAIQAEAHLQAKNHVVGGLSNSAPPVDGATPAQVNNSINEHYSKPVKHQDLETLINNKPQTTSDEIRRKNRAVAGHYDKPQNPAVDGKATGNSYVSKNKANCICPGNPLLGNSIVAQADKYGFTMHHGKTEAGCRKPAKDCNKPENSKKPRCTCCRVTAGQYLKRTCIQAECKPENPMGTYPSAAKHMDKAMGKASTKDHSKKLVLNKS